MGYLGRRSRRLAAGGIVWGALFWSVLSLALPAAIDQAAASEGEGSTLLSYDVYAGGLKAMRADLAVDLGGEDYRLQLDARFQGFIAKLFSLDMTVVTEGKLSGEALRPVSYDMHSIWQKSKERRITMAFEEGSARDVEIEPEDQKPLAPHLVSLEQREGAMDPITALLWPIAELLRSGACEGETKVFDGKKLFQLELEPRGNAVIEASSYSPFSGETLVCRLHIEQIAGKMKDKSKNRVPPFIDVYLAPLQPGGPPLPLKLEGTNLLGRIVLHLAEASGALKSEQLTQRPAE
ncbi:DUF3108 domain-containing protein [Limibacillus halophilus]|jgi:hypothetical protein